MGPADMGGMTDVRQIHCGNGIEKSDITPDQIGKSPRRFCRKGQQTRSGIGPGWFRSEGFGRLLYNDMGVGAAESKRTDGPVTHRTRGISFPRQWFGGNDGRNGVEPDQLPRLLEVKMRRNHFILKRQNDLDQPGHSCCCLAMADIGLDRTDHQGRLPFVRPAITPGNRLNLDRIAQRCSGAMGFQILHIRRRQFRTGQGICDQRFLGIETGRGQAVAEAVLIDHRRPNNGLDGIAVLNRLFQAFEDYHPTAVAADVPIGVGIECPATAVFRQHACPMERQAQV